MKAKNELQEEFEERTYFLRNTKNESLYLLHEKFIFYSKRGDVFPAQFSRYGRQEIVLVKKQNGEVIAEETKRNIYESSTFRKNSLWKFLRKVLGKELKNIECYVTDKVPEVYTIDDIIEVIKIHEKWSWEFNAIEIQKGIYHITFKYSIAERVREEITNDLMGKCLDTWENDNKTLVIQFLP